MSLVEFYLKTTNRELPVTMGSTHKQLRGAPAAPESYRQFDPIGQDRTETVRDSIHLDWIPRVRKCPECGVTVRMWDGFAHRLIFNRTWANAVAFQPISARYETDRWDSPIEGFVFRLWTWANPGDTFTFGRDMTEESEEDSVTTLKPSKKKGDGTEDEEEEESILTRYSHNDDSFEDDTDDSHRGQSSSPMEILGNMLPFGHPNLGARRLMAIHHGGKREQEQQRVRSANSAAAEMSMWRKKRNKKKLLHHHINSKETGAEVETAPPVAAESSLTRYLNVTESIYYATLNHTTPQLIRLFSHPIVQKCTSPSSRHPFSCLPHYNTQSNSSKYSNIPTRYFWSTFKEPKLIVAANRNDACEYC